MDDKKISFILCVNEEIWYEECLLYINNLNVPDGYQTDVISIREASSMAEGYNGGMKSSDAKYKVYLHQDTFLVNPNFIKDILTIFSSDHSIGMIGAVGCIKLPKSGCMWDTDERVVCAYENTVNKAYVLRNAPDEMIYIPVEVVDGMLMVTQYDLPWREDIFKGWDFYDASQCLEFKRAGYRVVTGTPRMPWCLHDCGMVNLSNYEKQREVFLKEYSKDF